MADPLLSGSLAQWRPRIVAYVKSVEGRVKALEDRSSDDVAIADLQESLRIAREQLVEVERVNAEQATLLVEADARLDKLEAKAPPASGGGSGSGSGSGVGAGNGAIKPEDGIARQHGELVWLLNNAQRGDTIRVQGKFTTSVVIEQADLTIEGISGIDPETGMPADELIWNGKHVTSSGRDKGILIYSLAKELRKPEPDADVTVRNLVLRGAKAGDGNGAGIRVNSDGSGPATKPMYRHITVENVWCLECQNGGLTVCSGTLTLRNVHSYGWGRGGDGIHGWYHTNQNVKTNTSKLVVRGYYSRNGAAGHGLKYRCGEADIDGLYIDGTNDESYEFECCQGGILRMRNFEITQGRRSQNPYVISFGAERRKGEYPVSRIEILEGRNIVRTRKALVRDRFWSFGSGTEGKPWNKTLEDGTVVPAVSIYGLSRIEYIWEPAGLKIGSADPLRAFTELDYVAA